MGKLLSTGEMILLGGGLFLLYKGVSVRAFGQEIIGIGGDTEGAYFAAPSGPSSGASWGEPITEVPFYFNHPEAPAPMSDYWNIVKFRLTNPFWYLPTWLGGTRQ